MSLNFSIVSARLLVIDINDRGSFPLCELRFYLPLDFQGNVLSGLRWLPLISRIVWAKNRQNPRDVAPLNMRVFTVFRFLLPVTMYELYKL